MDSPPISIAIVRLGGALCLVDSISGMRSFLPVRLTGVPAGHAGMQAWIALYAEFDLGEVEPAPVFGRARDFEKLSQPHKSGTGTDAPTLHPVQDATFSTACPFETPGALSEVRPVLST